MPVGCRPANDVNIVLSNGHTNSNAVGCPTWPTADFVTRAIVKRQMTQTWSAGRRRGVRLLPRAVRVDDVGIRPLGCLKGRSCAAVEPRPRFSPACSTRERECLKAEDALTQRYLSLDMTQNN